MSYVRGPGVQHWHTVDTTFGGPVGPQVSPSSGAWPTANLAIYVPVWVRSRVVVQSLWYGNESTATGNYDIGLYDATGVALLRRGSTAKTITTPEIVWDCTDTEIGPGMYYMALVSSTNSDTFAAYRPSAPYPAALGIYSEASALPLPATATFAVPQTLAYIPLVGMYLNALVT